MSNISKRSPQCPPAAEPKPERVTFGSITYEDPYRWLEEDSEEALSWQCAQDALTQASLKGLVSYQPFSRRIATLNEDPAVLTPKYAGGRWFRTRVPHGENLAVLEVADSPTGPGRRVVDLNTMPSDEPLKLDGYHPSPDGRKVLFIWSAGGRELEHFQAIDVDTGALLLDGVPQVRAYNASWLPDSNGFYFTGYDPAISMTHSFIYLQTLGAPPPIRCEDVDLSHPVSWAVTSEDGRYAFIYCDHLNPRPEFIRTIGDGGAWRPFLKGMPGMFRGATMGDRFVAITNDGAPRGRLVSIPLASPTERNTWQELIAGSDNVLASIVAVGDRLVLVDLIDTYGRLRVLAANGTVEREIALPGRGVVNTFGGTYALIAMMDSVARGAENEVLFVFSSPTQAPALYRANVVDGGLECLVPPAAELDASVADYRCESADGAHVSYRVVARRGIDRSKPLPAVIFGYGGFNAAFLPGWAGSGFAKWIEAGGALVLAHLRGGGEFGPDWWRAGRLEHKQNTFNDVYAIAEDLIRRGISSRQKLGVFGGSNGGTMAAAAAVQRPDLFRASVPQVPQTDILARVRDPIGMAATLDFGDPLDPEMSKIINAWSPYQNIVDGVAYPAVLVDSGANDPRCPAWHARKFVARLQAATSSDNPILLRVRAGAGHGAAGKSAQAEQTTEVFSFFAEQLGLSMT